MAQNSKLFTSRMEKELCDDYKLTKDLIITKLSSFSKWGIVLAICHEIFGYLEDLRYKLCLPDYYKLFVHEAMFRKHSFEEDLKRIVGDDWKSEITLPTAAKEYIKHIQDLEVKNKRLLMAHVYHLYMGLFIAVQNQPNNNSIIDINTYCIGHVKNFNGMDIKQLEEQISSAMNKIAVRMSEDEKEAIIEESRVVLSLTNSIINEIEEKKSYKSWFRTLFTIVLSACLIRNMYVIMKLVMGK